MTEPPLRVLLVGYGRMGRMVEQLAPEYGVEIAGRLARATPVEGAELPEADVAIDFSSAAAIPVNVPTLAARGLSVVIGTTGWQDSEPAVRRAVAEFPIAVLAAPNFAIGVNLFAAMAERASELLVRRGFAPYIHELHHAAKKDAPSGTALSLQQVVQTAGGQPVNMASTRAGFIPGTHTIGFDTAAESITLTHVARDRTPFARGALEAATWIRGRTGWFTMKDMLELGQP